MNLRRRLRDDLICHKVIFDKHNSHSLFFAYVLVTLRLTHHLGSYTLHDSDSFTTRWSAQSVDEYTDSGLCRVTCTSSYRTDLEG